MAKKHESLAKKNSKSLVQKKADKIKQKIVKIKKVKEKKTKVVKSKTPMKIHKIYEILKHFELPKWTKTRKTPMNS